MEKLLRKALSDFISTNEFDVQPGDPYDVRMVRAIKFVTQYAHLRRQEPTLFLSLQRIAGTSNEAFSASRDWTRSGIALRRP